MSSFSAVHQGGRSSDTSDSDSDSDSSTSTSSNSTSDDDDTSRSVPLPYAAPVPFQRSQPTPIPNDSSSGSDSDSDSDSESDGDSSDSSDKGNDKEASAVVPVPSLQQQTTVHHNQEESSSDSDSDSSDSDSDSDTDSDDNKKGDTAAVSVPPVTAAATTATTTSASEKKKKPFWSAKPIVYIKGLPFSTSLVEIKNFFGSCGDIVKVDRQLDDKKRWTGSIFMKFDSSDSVDKALAMTGCVWSGTGGDGKRFVTVDKQDQKKSAKRRQKTKNGATHSVFIGNLQKKVEKQAIQELFVECGTISSIRFAKDTEGDCRGFGYIEFDSEDGKNKALTMNHRFTLDDNAIQVRKAQNNSTNQKPAKPKPAKKEKEKEEKTGKKRVVNAGGSDNNTKKKVKTI